jgi:hypothetical protein
VDEVLGTHRWLTGGCHPNRDTVTAITTAGLRVRRAAAVLRHGLALGAPGGRRFSRLSNEVGSRRVASGSLPNRVMGAAARQAAVSPLGILSFSPDGLRGVERGDRRMNKPPTA